MRAAAAKQKQGPSRASLVVGQRQSKTLETGNVSEMSALGAHSSSQMSALQKVYQVLVDCLDPDPVLDKLLEMGFHKPTIQDIREERITSDKNRKLIEAVKKSGDKAYCNFKSSLAQCRQEQLFNLLEKMEKGDNTLDLQRELRKKARGQIKPTSDLQRRTLREKTREQMKPTSDLQRRTLYEKAREQMKPTSELQRRPTREKARNQMKPTSDLRQRTIREKAREQIKPTSDLQRRTIREKAREQMTPESEDKKLYEDLKEDIITYYREHESMIPASPLVDEHNVPIEDLYVLPPMWAYNDSYFEPSNNRPKGNKTSGNDRQDKREITIKGLFLSGNVRYRKIYITANAGFGKTSLSQTLTMTWCQSHSPMTSLTENYKGENLAAMKYFDLLILLHLRDYQDDPECNLDDLIMKMVSANLSRKSKYTNEFIEIILHEKKCLVILDGLDEWSHPARCPKKPEVPHNNHPDSCTVLTTTRDWKIGTVRLSPKDIDRRVEISMLDDVTREQLEEKAIEILNERNLNLAKKNTADFDEEVKTVEIGNIICIPYILLQLMCLFFGGLPIGKSKCEIYSNITEFTLKRGLKKKDLPDIHVQTNDYAAVRNCLKQNKKCNLYFNLIMKLGKLACFALFNEKQESSLIFDRKYAKLFMTKQEIEFCLKVGLLCQTKDSSIFAVKRYQVFFQHKSVQEFFSAIYVTSEWQNESVKSTILNVCSSLSGILEMSNVFVFVCGMNPKVYTCISGKLQTIVDLDEVTRRYRTYMYMYTGGYGSVYYDFMETMKSYQSMQVQCLQESVRNGNDSCSSHLHDYILTKEDLTSLKIIINFNKGNVKSLQLSDSDKITTFLQSLDPGVFTSLETLRVEGCDKEPEWLADILTESARTLKCLTLSLGLGSLSDISLTVLTGLTCLQSLYLRGVHMTHSNLKCLYAYISQTTTLTQLKLKYIHCSDHRGQYRDCDVNLDLHRPNELKMLHLYIIPCRELHVDPVCLEKLKFLLHGEEMTARAIATLWQDLRAAPVLSSLTLSGMSTCQEMIQTIPTLAQLQYLKLRWIDFDGVIPRFSPAMTHLERVELSFVTMSSAAWRQLLRSVGKLQHPVTVELYSCRGSSREEWLTFMDEIKSTPTLSWIQDLDLSFDDDDDDDNDDDNDDD